MSPSGVLAFPFCILLLAAAGRVDAQSKKPEDLGVGKVLVTPREAPDPVFAESVILLVRYDENGALGLMINHRTTVPISRVLREIAGSEGHADPVFVGGPVGLDTVMALGRADHSPEGATDVSGKIYFITAKASLEKALAQSANPAGLRVYIGYCGWGPHQLENEVRHGVWYVFDKSADLAFDSDPAKLWPKLIGRTEDLMAWLGVALPTAHGTSREETFNQVPVLPDVPSPVK